jgi:hypothetical protein
VLFEVSGRRSVGLGCAVLYDLDLFDVKQNRVAMNLYPDQLSISTIITGSFR